MLALNLLCAAFTRWPWQRKHIGFVVTHAGIILMLTGAVIGRTFGFEAFVTLDKTKPPENRLFMHDTMLTIEHLGRRARRDAVRHRDASADGGAAVFAATGKLAAEAGG